MKNKLVFVLVMLMLLAMGALAGSLVYSAIFLASSLANRLFWLQWAPIASITLLAIVVLVTAYFAVGLVRQSRAEPLPKLRESDLLPMTIIIPALNEEKVLEQCVDSIMKATYPPDRLEVAIAYEVPPRCRDRTPEIAERLARTYPNVRAVPNDGEHRGTKAGAVNNCLRGASGEIIGIYDADHVIEKDALLRASVQFAADPSLGSIGGKVMVRKMDHNLFTFLVGNEYTVINNFSRFFSELLTGTHLLYGSNVFIRREALNAIGGFDESSLTEDCDLGMRLISKSYGIRIDYTIKSYEQPAVNFVDWWHQRVRWTRGSVDVLKKYIKGASLGDINTKAVRTIILYSLGTGGLLFSVILLGFLGFMLYVNVVPPIILFAFCAPLAVLFAAESYLQIEEGRGSLQDMAMSLFVRPWIIFMYSLVGVYAVVLDVLDARRTWEENQRV
jgi:cellulose synthase/poly-beta-1,6-N-acetylglucosamine synthase-like glycosyltransferase